MKWLKLTKPRMRGPEVSRLQEILLYLGYDIGPYGADGIFGEATSNAVRLFQRKYGLIEDGTVGNLETWPMFLDVLEVKVGKHPAGEPNVIIVDRRGQHEPPGLYRAHRSPRPWKGEGENVILGVTLHQSGCVISPNPRMYELGNYHIAIMQSGVIVLVNPLEWFIWHGNELSHSTIGIVFDGNFPGIAGDPQSVYNEGSKADTLTEAQVRAAMFLLPWLKMQFEINGGQWKYVYGHRQASQYRRADPGSEIWDKVALPWMNYLGATDGGPEFIMGNGVPIPMEWNPDYEVHY